MYSPNLSIFQQWCMSVKIKVTCSSSKYTVSQWWPLSEGKILVRTDVSQMTCSLILYSKVCILKSQGENRCSRPYRQNPHICGQAPAEISWRDRTWYFRVYEETLLRSIDQWPWTAWRTSTWTVKTIRASTSFALTCAVVYLLCCSRWIGHPYHPNHGGWNMRSTQFHFTWMLQQCSPSSLCKPRSS